MQARTSGVANDAEFGSSASISAPVTMHLSMLRGHRPYREEVISCPVPSRFESRVAGFRPTAARASHFRLSQTTPGGCQDGTSKSPSFGSCNIQSRLLASSLDSYRTVTHTFFPPPCSSTASSFRISSFGDATLSGSRAGTGMPAERDAECRLRDNFVPAVLFRRKASCDIEGTTVGHSCRKDKVVEFTPRGARSCFR